MRRHALRNADESLGRKQCNALDMPCPQIVRSVPLMAKARIGLFARGKAACSSRSAVATDLLLIYAQIMSIKEFGDRDVYVNEHNLGSRCRVRALNLLAAIVVRCTLAGTFDDFQPTP